MGFFSHNSGSRYTRRSIKGSKDADDCLVSRKSLRQKMAHWLGAQGQVNWSKCKNMTSLWRHQQKNTNQIKKWFLIKTTRLAESVN